MGYHRAGFDVLGVDHLPQPRYPFPFVRADALDYLAAHGREFDAIHASPPCQRFSRSRTIHGSGDRHPDLIPSCRDLLANAGRPWVVENVPEARLNHPAVLCGLMFGLRVLRHRAFEASFLLLGPSHPRHPGALTTGTSTRRGNGYSTGRDGLVCVAGHNFNRAAGAWAMGIDWPMSQRDLALAVPPAFTEFIGRQLRAVLEARAG
jgi:DNA (cytosine-5)-methyltransferase 1